MKTKIDENKINKSDKKDKEPASAIGGFIIIMLLIIYGILLPAFFINRNEVNKKKIEKLQDRVDSHRLDLIKKRKVKKKERES
jgi:hypothetical protein